jgi:hypothetical protein
LVGQFQTVKICPGQFLGFTTVTSGPYRSYGMDYISGRKIACPGNNRFPGRTTALLIPYTVQFFHN